MNALLLLLPVVGAPIVHAPVLTWNLLPWLAARPLDGGRTWRGHRLFGANKTWRGALFMTLGPLLATLVLWQWPWWRDAIPDGASEDGPWLIGLLVGLGVVLGELPNSLLKRQLDVAPGTQRSGLPGLALTVLDQGDLVVGIWFCLLPIYLMNPLVALLGFAVVSAIHLGVNVIGHAIGARSSRL